MEFKIMRITLRKLFFGLMAGVVSISFLGCATAEGEGRNADINICQFNMRFDCKNDGRITKTYKDDKGRECEVRDGSCTWEKRCPLIKDFLRYNEVDICGTQELYKNQVDDMRKMEEYAIFGVPTTPSAEAKGKVNHNNVIIYRKDRFDLLESGVFWFSDTPEKESRGWGAAYPRNCNWGKFLDKKTGKTFHFFNMHFHHIGENIRLESAKLLVKKIREIAGDGTFFAMGDLNSNPTTQAIGVIQASGYMHDARKISKTPFYGPKFTDNYWYTGKGTDWTNWIDWIFVSGDVNVLKFGVLADNQNGVWLSDHFPLLIKAKIGN